jgi:hypothetical protein
MIFYMVLSQAIPLAALHAKFSCREVRLLTCHAEKFSDLGGHDLHKVDHNMFMVQAQNEATVQME